MFRGLAAISVMTIGVLLAGCASQPTGPTVLAVPGKNKSFSQFQQDDYSCRNYAQTVIGPTTPGQAGTQSAVGGAAAGTLLGAAAGALIGAAAGNVGAGAAIGAGSGLLVGTSVGASNGQAASGSLQQRYDFAYIQCMTANGENIQTAYTAPAYAYPAYGYAPPVVVAPPVTIGLGFGGGYYGNRGYWGGY